MDTPVLDYASVPPVVSRSPARTAAVLVAMAAAGVVSIVLPVLISPPARWYTSETLVPAIRTGIETFSIASGALLFVSGVIGGAASAVKPVWLGFATMSVFPLLAFAEMAKWPTSHNLIPFELGMYAIMSIPAIVGAFAGRAARRVVAS